MGSCPVGAGNALAENSTVHLELDGSRLGDLAAYRGEAFEGDFDAVVRFSAENWTHQPGESRFLSLIAESEGAKNFAYIALLQKDSLTRCYSTDVILDKRGRGWINSETTDYGGILRIARQNGSFSTYYWSECQWVRLDRFTVGFTDPVYIGLSVSNKDEAKVNTSLNVDFTVEQIQSGEEVGENWTPDYCRSSGR